MADEAQSDEELNPWPVQILDGDLEVDPRALAGAAGVPPDATEKVINALHSALEKQIRRGKIPDPDVTRFVMPDFSFQGSKGLLPEVRAVHVPAPNPYVPLFRFGNVDLRVVDTRSLEDADEKSADSRDRRRTDRTQPTRSEGPSSTSEGHAEAPPGRTSQESPGGESQSHSHDELVLTRSGRRISPQVHQQVAASYVRARDAAGLPVPADLRRLAHGA